MPLTPPNLTNRRFKSFQRNPFRYKGLDYSSWLKQNVFVFWSHSNFYLSSKHVDLIFRYLKWKLKKSGTPQFIIPLNYPITKKPTEVRMGKGKGAISDWAIPIKKNTHFFYFNTLYSNSKKNNLKQLIQKLPLKISIDYINQNITELNNYSINNFYFRKKIQKYLKKKIF